MICSIEGCEIETITRGWCQMHYARWRREGTPGEAERRIVKPGYGGINHNREKLRDYLLYKSCMDCGEDRWAVLEFDHVRGEKTTEVSEMVNSNYSWRRVLEEISKCEVVCANCHGLRTSLRTNGYRTRPENSS